MALQDVRQGAASIVFLVAYAFLSVLTLYALITRRPIIRFLGPFVFCFIRVGANVASLGWSIALYTNFDWLVASLVLGAEGYFALILTILFSVIAYEKQTFGDSTVLPRSLPGDTKRDKWRKRMRSPVGIFEQLLVIPNVLVIIGGSNITSGLSKLKPADYVNASSEIIGNLPKIKSGRRLRTIGQALFALGIVIVYGYLYTVFRRVGKKEGNRLTLMLLAASAPFMFVRAAFGILAAASFEWSYYNPYAYGEDGLLQKQLVGDLVMGYTTEIITVILVTAASFYLTVPKAQYVKKKDRVPQGQGEEVNREDRHVELDSLESPPLDKRPA